MNPPPAMPSLRRSPRAGCWSSRSRRRPTASRSSTTPRLRAGRAGGTRNGYDQVKSPVWGETSTERTESTASQSSYLFRSTRPSCSRQPSGRERRPGSGSRPSRRHRHRAPQPPARGCRRAPSPRGRPEPTTPILVVGSVHLLKHGVRNSDGDRAVCLRVVRALKADDQSAQSQLLRLRYGEHARIDRNDGFGRGGLPPGQDSRGSELNPTRADLRPLTGGGRRARAA